MRGEATGEGLSQPPTTRHALPDRGCRRPCLITRLLSVWMSEGFCPSPSLKRPSGFPDDWPLPLRNWRGSAPPNHPAKCLEHLERNLLVSGATALLSPSNTLRAQGRLSAPFCPCCTAPSRGLQRPFGPCWGEFERGKAPLDPTAEPGQSSRRPFGLWWRNLEGRGPSHSPATALCRRDEGTQGFRLLLRLFDPRLHQVPDRDHARQLPMFHHRQVPAATLRHDGEAVGHAGGW